MDIAARAGVHPATVSRALNLPEKVAPATRARVEEAVKELGFVPNRAARRLITGRTDNLAVIVPDITNPHFASLVRSVERAARQVGLQVLLMDTGEQPEEELRAARTLASEVDGFVVISARRVHRSLEALGGKRAVFVNRPVRDHASVLFRTAPAVADALRHLGGLGHRRLAYLGGPSRSWAAGERRNAVRRTSAAMGMELSELVVAEPVFDAAVGVVEEIVGGGASAVIAFNDQMALGVVAGMARLGVRVPDDLSVIGFDDVPMAAMVAPPLTTISMPTDEAGAAAVAMLRDGTSRQELLGALVTRQSTGPVKGARATAAARRARPSSGAGHG